MTIHTFLSFIDRDMPLTVHLNPTGTKDVKQLLGQMTDTIYIDDGCYLGHKSLRQRFQIFI